MLEENEYKGGDQLLTIDIRMIYSSRMYGTNILEYTVLFAE